MGNSDMLDQTLLLCLRERVNSEQGPIAQPGFVILHEFHTVFPKVNIQFSSSNP